MNDSKSLLDTVPGELRALHGRLDKGGERMSAIEGRLGNLETKMDKNTEMTERIEEAVTAGKVGKKVVVVLGALAAAGSAIWVFVYQLLHGGKLPGQ